jgi:hypothetical protein
MRDYMMLNFKYSKMLKKGAGWSLIIFCARATRGLRRPSLDARSGRSVRPIPKEVTSKLGRSIIEMWALDARSKGQPRPLPLSEV